MKSSNVLIIGDKVKHIDNQNTGVIAEIWREPDKYFSNYFYIINWDNGNKEIMESVRLIKQKNK